jgi:hypothetical protein
VRVGTLCYVKPAVMPREYGGKVCEVVSEKVPARSWDGRDANGYSCRFPDGAVLLTEASLLIPITPPGASGRERVKEGAPCQ